MTDQLQLKSGVGKGGANQQADVLLVQACLSLIKNNANQPYYSGRVDGRCGPKSCAAIVCFMANNRFLSQPTIRSSSPALRKLSELADKALRAKGASIKPHLTFDGKKLCWVGKLHNGKCWSGISGAKGFQEAKHQSLKDKGPLPEGRWRVRQDEYQKYDDIPLAKKLKSFFGGGTWPGGTDSWGNNRIWLKPKSVPNLYGRDKFTIHGGTTPGSLGCIDLTQSMPDFTKVFRDYGGDMDLVVNYGQSEIQEIPE